MEQNTIVPSSWCCSALNSTGGKERKGSYPAPHSHQDLAEEGESQQRGRSVREENCRASCSLWYKQTNKCRYILKGLQCPGCCVLMSSQEREAGAVPALPKEDVAPWAKLGQHWLQCLAESTRQSWGVQRLQRCHLSPQGLSGAGICLFRASFSPS